MADREPKFGGLRGPQATPAVRSQATSLTQKDVRSQLAPRASPIISDSQLQSTSNGDTQVIVPANEGDDEYTGATEGATAHVEVGSEVEKMTDNGLKMVQEPVEKKKRNRRTAKTAGKRKCRLQSHRNQARHQNEANRTQEHIEVREKLRENPDDANARAVFARYNPEYEGNTIEKGVGVTRNVPGSTRIDSLGRLVSIREDGRKTIKLRRRRLADTNYTNSQEGIDNFGRDVFEAENSGISFGAFKDLREIDGADGEDGTMTKSLRLRYRELQSIDM